jgi:hypothetical protein
MWGEEDPSSRIEDTLSVRSQVEGELGNRKNVRKLPCQRHQVREMFEEGGKCSVM